MEAAAQWLVIAVIVLTAIAYAIKGLGWLVENEPVYLVLGVLAVGAIAYFWYRSGRPATSRVDTGAMVTRARRSEQLLVESRRVLEREADALQNLRFEVRDEVNFEVYRQAHRESRLIADRWYEHKRSAVETRKEISAGLNRLRANKRRLDRMSGGTTRRGRFNQEAQAAQSVIDSLDQALSSLSAEVSRGARSLDAHNRQTGRLRDHIRDHCGPRGRRWFEQLQARKKRVTGTG
ncbi:MULTISPECIES: hypothetical protein [Streptomyces]|uniref:Uncharacterized protein n=1 Tax=Streptomyces spororaveus TaxID=284039 RepID=A0ABQ3T843_9ACTN|nr:hypothetical protein [Streptomyces spororaveus]MCM9083003.1 hypothetical protein [Streptomyces spororaveus]GHI76563.1 hypothetical protein Sspor_21240 [Streptomyces spororaveus]